MRLLLIFIITLLRLPVVQGQGIHPLSDPDLLFGKVSQVKEIYYLEPKKGEAIDTLEKRIYWYNINGMTDDIQRARHTRTGWASNPNEFDLRLKKFGDPPMTTGRDGMDFKIQYDYLGNEIERSNYNIDGSLATRIRFFYGDKNVMTKSETFRGSDLSFTIAYTYDQNRLVKEHITFPNKTVFDVAYTYEGFDSHNNWMKRIRVVTNGDKEDRPQVTERRVLYYP